MLLHNLVVNGQFVLVDEFWCDASYAYKNEGYWPDATSRYLNVLPRETKKRQNGHTWSLSLPLEFLPSLQKWVILKAMSKVCFPSFWNLRSCKKSLSYLRGPVPCFYKKRSLTTFPTSGKLTKWTKCGFSRFSLTNAAKNCRWMNYTFP